MRQDKDPGCFGLALNHKAIPTCKSCTAIDRCRKDAKATLLSLGEFDPSYDSVLKFYLDVEVDQQPESSTLAVKGPAMQDKSKVVLSSTHLVLIDSLPVKTQPVVRVMLEQGVDMNELTRGRNPFAKRGPEFMRTACQCLLEGGMTKAFLKEKLRRNRQVADATAASYVSMAFATLKAFNVITEDHGYYTIRGTL